MNKNTAFSVCKALLDQRGQVLPWVTFGMVSFLGMAGLTIDVGNAYVVRSQLQNATNAAALAAATDVYFSGSTVTAMADKYASNVGDYNYNPYVTGTPTVTQRCLNLLELGGSTCGTGSTPNAVQVTQTADVPTYFLRVLNITHIPLQATALASMAGPAHPWNVAVIEDATGSMANTDTNCGGISQFQCALQGIQQLLANTNPCPTGMATCTSAQANFHIALFEFPDMLLSALPSVNACSGATYTSPLPYTVMTLPLPTATSYAPMTYTQGATTWTATYELTYGASDADANGFVSDYWDPSDTATGGLNPNSSIVQAVGYGGSGTGNKVGCMNLSPGGINLNGAQTPPAASPPSGTKVNTTDVGEGITYYASVIYAAQSALTAEAVLHPGAQNAIILLSDGQANTQWIYFPEGTLTQTPTKNLSQPSTISASLGYSTLNTVHNANALAAMLLSTPNQEATALNANTGLYPDFLDECQQAIVAAQYAVSKGTRIYAVAYGSEDSGCGSGSHADDYTDVTTVATGKNASFTASSLTPCITMENIASDLKYFYSDYLQSGSGVDTSCVSSANQLTSLANIFDSISSSFTTARLLPFNAS